jgi:hypothetical protein
MKVLSVVENEDGSANIELDLTKEEAQKFIEYAVVDLLKKHIEATENDGTQQNKTDN